MTIKTIAYRGEHGESNGKPFHSRLGAVSFGSVAAARLYATSPNHRDDYVISSRIIVAEVTINKPVMNSTSDPFIDFPIIVDAIGVEKAKRIALEQEGHIFNTDNWCTLSDEHGCDTLQEFFDKVGVAEALDELYMDAYPVFDSPIYVEWFKEAGFDGAVQGSNGATHGTTEYKIFNHDQARILKVLPVSARDKESDLEAELAS